MSTVIEIEKSPSGLEKILAMIIIAGFIASVLGFGALKIIQAKAESKFISEPSPNFELAAIQKNSLLAVSNPVDPIKPAKKIKMVVTAYSSTLEETDDSPFITASGKTVEEGIVANNLLPFGTEIRIPELYGDKIFVVEDRMNWTKGHYHLDIWFPNYWQAKDFGAKRAYIEILES